MTAGLSSHGLTVEELFAPQMRCSYPSKVCNNPRAVKLCGSLHKLCEFHRKKANTNQKRLQQRRRVIRAQMAERATPLIDQNASAYCQSAPSIYSVNLINLLKTDLPTTTMPATTTTTANTYKDDELSVFERGLLDSLVFGAGGGGVATSYRELPAAPIGGSYGYESYTVEDQAHWRFEPFSYELRL